MRGRALHREGIAHLPMEGMRSAPMDGERCGEIRHTTEGQIRPAFRLSGVWEMPVYKEGTYQKMAQKYKWWTLIAACFALFMAILDNLVVNIALPTISRELNASTTQLQWIVSAY